MSFEGGILEGVTFQAAEWIGGAITPEIVVLHDTASRISYGSAANYLAHNDRKVSVHFVIERNGELVQQVPIDRQANHAGRSSYHGRKWCNGFSFGIEIVNPGRMTRYSDTEAQAWYGQRFDIQDFGIQEIATPEHGHGLWMPYTEEQMDTLIDLLAALFNQSDALRDITTHWYVSPGRKVDTNPLFPLEHIRSLILGREDPQGEAADEASTPVGGDELVQIDVPGDALNFRRWPSFNPNVITTIPDQAIVPVLRQGMFDDRQWLCVQYAGQEGWIVARYAAPIIHSAGAGAGFTKGNAS